MKKVLIGILTLVIFLLPITSIYANDTQESISYNFAELGVEVTFDSNTQFSQEQQKRIAEILAKDITPPESKAWCWLTGHKYISDAVTVTTHEARLYNPRCLEQLYEVTTCQNCNYYAEDLLSSIYVVCCPEE